MSSRLVGLVLEHYPHGGNELLLAIALADEADHGGGNVRAAVPEMARLSRQTEQNARRLLRKMEVSGWLECIERGGGRGKMSLYRISPDWVKLPLGFHFGQKTLPDKPEQKGNLMFGFNGPKGELNVPLSEGSPFLLKHFPPLSPQIDHQATGSAVPSASAVDQSENLKLARWMFDRVLKLHQLHREPNWKRWQRDIVVMVRKGHSLHDIASLFHWANADPFWQANIRSPSALWAQWDTLTIKRKQQAEQKTQVLHDSGAPKDPLCSRCRTMPFTVKRGRNGPCYCSACADAVELESVRA